jgi:hypothetical protein
MGHLVVVNGEVKNGTIFRSEERAQKERTWWETHFSRTGRKLTSFDVQQFNPDNPAHRVPGNSR